MALTFNQNFVPGWNTIYSNLIDKVAKTIITANQYQSPFSQMVQSMEVGNYVEDIHINPGAVLLQDTITASDILSSYVDDVAVAVYPVTVDLVYPSTVREYVVRTGFTFLDNVSEFVSALTANIRTTLEYHRNNLVKQMLFNAYQFGMLPSVTIPDPRTSADNAANYAITLNSLIDDFRTEINTRNIIYNLQNGIVADDYRHTITNQFPYVITFSEFVRYVEFMQALKLGLVERFRSGNSNQDWEERLITLTFADFPTSIPPIDRSSVVGQQNVSARNINFFEMPTDANGADLFSGTPTGGNTAIGFVIDPAAIKILTQLQIKTSWLNPANLDQTNREIIRCIMELGAFNKICAVTTNI